MQLADTLHWLVEPLVVRVVECKHLTQGERTITAVINFHTGMLLRSTHTSSQVW